MGAQYPEAVQAFDELLAGKAACPIDQHHQKHLEGRPMLAQRTSSASSADTMRLDLIAPSFAPPDLAAAAVLMDLKAGLLPLRAPKRRRSPSAKRARRVVSSPALQGAIYTGHSLASSLYSQLYRKVYSILDNVWPLSAPM